MQSIEPTTPEPITLTNCDREPIHIPGATQPHGGLLVLDDAMRIVQMNGSAPALLGLAPESILLQPLSSIVPADDLQHISTHLALRQRNPQPIYLRPIRAGSHRFDAILHRSDGLTVLELEPVEPHDSTADPYALVQEAIVEFRTAGGLDELVGQIARHVRTLNGFDRVMVYRFDRDWNGQVIAEEKRDDLEPFLGLNYPASDIPVQARELYRKNWLRFIADRDYVPAPLIPQINPATGRPLDMSFCVLRSVSPIHLEYLRNMGVGASMSISLICNGELWGLVACHHYSARRVPYQLRSAAELLGEVMSLQVVASNSLEMQREAADNQQRIDSVLRKFDPARGTIGLLETCGDDLGALLDCGGLAVVSDGDVLRFGQAPAAPAVLEILAAIRAHGRFEVFNTDSLRRVTGRATLDPIASGVIAVALTADGSRALIGFRPERLRTVNWAGDPAKSVIKGDGEARLSPRGSFTLWKQTVEGQSHPWSTNDLTAARILRQRCMEKLVAYAEEVQRHNQVLRQHGQEQERLFEAERAARLNVEHLGRVKDDFVATLSHELRTPLNAIQGWAQLLRARPNLEGDIEEGLEVIERNTRVQVQMVEDLLDMSRITSGKLRLDVQIVDLPGTIEAGIATVQMAADAKQIQIIKFLDPLHGLSITGDPHRLQQVFWNLLSNAVKFSPKGSHIRVELKRVNSHIEASVRDNGIGIDPAFLPHVFDRFRQGDEGGSRQQRGLGLGLAIVRNLVELHGGTISVQSPGAGQGSVFTVTLPVRAVTAEDLAQVHPTAAGGGGAAENAVNLRGLNLLIVEDEFDSRELLRRLFENSGAEVSTAGSAADALNQLFNRRFDAMISDIGLPGQDGYYLIEQLRQLESRTNRPKMPAVAVTAYARTEDRRRIMLAGFQAHIAKPVEPDELRAVVASITGRV